MSGVRVTYSGLISFGISLISVITGLIFVILVTRKLSTEEFGLWTFIGSIVAQATIISPIVTYWVTRQVARGEKIEKTALTTSGLLSLGGFVIYLILAFYVSNLHNIDFRILLIGSTLIPLTFFLQTLNSICLSLKPQAISYGLIVFELVKIPLGIILVVTSDLGLIGALIATIGATVANILLLVFVIKDKIFGAIKTGIIKFWIKMSWLSLYGILYELMWKFDVLIFSSFTTSLVGLAYWGVAGSITSMVVYSGKISDGLYSKLIATGKNEFAHDNFTRSLYFAIPILSANIVLAKPLLHVLNPLYEEGIYVVIILSIRGFVHVIMGFYFSLIQGNENIDLNKTASTKQFIKSNLFVIPTFMLLFSIIYVGSLFIFLAFFKTPQMSDYFLISIWAMILLATTIIFTIVGMLYVRKKLHFNFNYIPILKYAAVALLASIIVYLVSEKVLKYSERIFDFLPQLIPILILGGGIYFGITYLIDMSTKIFFKSFLNEFRRKRSIK